MRHLTFYDSEDRPWPNERLKSSAIIGHTTETTTRIWIRGKKEGTYWLVLESATGNGLPTMVPPSVDRAADGSATDLINGAAAEKIEVTNDKDRTGVFEVDGLAAGTRYNYAVVALDPNDPGQATYAWVIGKDEALGFKTQAANPDRVTFGLYSCHMPYDGANLVNMDMWALFNETLKDTEADFVMCGGDQVYTDGNRKVSIWNWLKKNKKDVQALPKKDRHDVMVSWYRDIYRGYWGPLDLRKVYRSFPCYMIWDDHEIMDGWGSYTRKELSNHLDTIWEWENVGKNVKLAKGMFEAAKQVYAEYQHSHNPPTRESRYDYGFDWGPAAFYVLDLRGNRNYGAPKHPILGNAQFKRFEDWMKIQQTSKSNAIFIVSPVPVVHNSEFVVNHLDLPALGIADDLRDEWEHKSHWVERDKLLDIVFKVSKESGKRVIFLSGDVHVGAAFKLSRKNHEAARVYQLTSSAITYHLDPLIRKLLKLIVRKNGSLKYARKEKEPVTFSLLHDVMIRNNFGIIRMHNAQEDNPEIWWDLYSNTAEPGGSMKMRRLAL
jgi:alkaline phosphatase D